jgi:hypothetical protein
VPKLNHLGEVMKDTLGRTLKEELSVEEFMRTNLNEIQKE